MQPLANAKIETAQESDLLLRSLETAVMAIHTVSADGTILWANAAELLLLGYDRAEYIGRSIVDFHVDRAAIGELLQRIIRGEKIRDHEAQLKCRDGTVKTVLIDSSGAYREGQFWHTLCFTRDITGRKMADVQLRQQASEASGHAQLYQASQTELTAQKHATEALLESQARFQAFLDNSAAVIYAKDLDGKYLFINGWYEKLFGVKSADLLGKTDFDFFPKEQAEIFRENDLHVIRTGKSLEVEEIARKGAVRLTFLSIKFPLHRSDGTIYASAGISTDITTRIQGEEASRRLAALVESSDDAIIGKDLNGIITSWNKGAERIFGYKAQEMIGTTIMRLIPTERSDEETAILSRIRRGERIEHYETVRRRKNGSLVEIALTVSPIKDVQGRIVGASKIGRDITDRRRLENEQRAVYELLTTVNRTTNLRAIFEESLKCICTCQRVDRASILISDSRGILRFEAWRGLSDTYRAAVEGHSPWARDDPAPAPIFVEDIDKARFDDALKAVVVAEGIGALAFLPLVYEKRLLGKFMICHEKPHIFVNSEIRLLQTIALQLAFAVERHRTSEALELLVDERTSSLREAVAQMEEFSYTVSHDLRAPLRAMRSYSQALLEDFAPTLPEEAAHYLHRISENASRLDKMILDVLTFSRIARAELYLEIIPLETFVRNIIENYPTLQAPLAEIRLQPLLPVLGHEPSLTQAISNLLNNAVKFVPPGVMPKIRIWTEKRGPDVRLWIEDNGIGIKPEYQHRLFSMFERINPTSRYEGTGVGLAIVRKALERMGGRAGMESDGFNGSRFWIQLKGIERESAAS